MYIDFKSVFIIDILSNKRFKRGYVGVQFGVKRGQFRGHSLDGQDKIS